MPIGERLVESPEPVRARFRKPLQCAELLRIKGYAIVDNAFAMLVIVAPAGSAVEQFAGDVGREQLPRFFVLELMKAASAAAVAQGLPLAAIQLLEGLFPEWLTIIHDKASHALLRGRNQGGVSDEQCNL